jgi:hypothetical protein
MISAIAETTWRQQRIRQVSLAPPIFGVAPHGLMGHVGCSVACFEIDSCAAAHLKLVCFPAHSPLPTAALPSMSLSPKAPFDLSVPISVARVPAAPLKLVRFPAHSSLPLRLCLLRADPVSSVHSILHSLLPSPAVAQSGLDASMSIIALAPLPG